MRSQPTPSFNSQSIGARVEAAIASRPSTAGWATGLPSHRPRDPLHRAGRYPELSRDLVKAGTARSRQSVTNLLFRLSWHSGTPEGFAALGAARFGPHDYAALLGECWIPVPLPPARFNRTQ
jgi:hypothetical protein